MSKRLDARTAADLRSDARSLEKYAGSEGNYPTGTIVRRGQGPSRMFNVRLSDAQYQQVAGTKHLPVSTMARAWLLGRLEREQHAP